MGLIRIGPMLFCALALSGCGAPNLVTGPVVAPTAIIDPRAPLGPPGDQRQATPVAAGHSARFEAQRGAVRPGNVLPTAEATGTGAERAFVTDILRDLQLRSFATNSEHCGYIGLDPAGNLVSTEILQGTEASCTLPQVPPGMVLLASFHTHGTYSPYYASEFPTTTDMLTDAADNIDGYISTPGGRLWYVDTDTMTVRQLCGRGCLPQDPNYVAADDGPVREMFTLADLRAFERS